MRSLATFIAAFLIAVPNLAWAWGNEGHEIIALIAANRLSSAAKSQIEGLLGGDASTAMAAASTWADKVRRKRPETAHWHYVDIEIDSAGYSLSACPNDDCVVGQIQKDIAIVRNITLSQPVRAETLRFLIHFIGDLHQPLHAADNHDRGGNEVLISLKGRRKNLHAVWDTDVVKALGGDPGFVATMLETDITPDKAHQWMKGSTVDWANQSLRIAQNAIYHTLPGDGGTDAPVILPENYLASSNGIVRTQLQRAGVRLAAVLNSLFKSPFGQSN